MTLTRKTIPVLLLLVVFTSCDHFTYTPRSRKNVQREKPSIVLLERIVTYREEQNAWPFSKEEFISKGQKYKEVFEGFPYLYTNFKIIDNNTMIFYFNDHKKDVQNFKETQQAELNRYGGQVRFYKENDKFIWKLKMN